MHASPCLPLSERSLNPTSTPRHTHLSLNICLVFSMMLHFFSSMDTEITNSFYALVPHQINGIINGRSSTIKVHLLIALELVLAISQSTSTQVLIPVRVFVLAILQSTSACTWFDKLDPRPTNQNWQLGLVFSMLICSMTITYIVSFMNS